MKKQILIGVFEAMGALAGKLTGESLEICVHDEAGRGVWFYVGANHRWINCQENRDEVQHIVSSDRPESVSTLGDTRNGPNAIATTPS
jgi:hypothetical protein